MEQWNFAFFSQLDYLFFSGILFISIESSKNYWVLEKLFDIITYHDVAKVYDRDTVNQNTFISFV